MHALVIPPFIKTTSCLFGRNLFNLVLKIADDISLSTLTDGGISWSILILCDDDVIAPEPQVKQIAETNYKSRSVLSLYAPGYDSIY
jgi:hypothetical protein